MTTETLSTDLTTRLNDFARTVRGAARAVSLYPATHPSIQAALARVVSVSERLTADGDVALIAHPDTIAIDGRAPARAEAGVRELAELLHAHLVGELRIARGTGAEDWHALLLLLGRAPEDLRADGGIGAAWAASGRNGFNIREIDYASVLRERGGGDAAEWDRVLAHCLRGDAADLDERTLASLLDVAGDPARFGTFLERLQEAPGEAMVGVRAAAMLRIMRGLIRALSATAPDDVEQLLRSMAAATARLSPEMMLALISRARSGDGTEEAAAAGQIVQHLGRDTVASFVAGSVIAERGATARLAQAFETLVPDVDQRQPVLDAAHEEVAQSPLGGESGFEDLWQHTAGMLLSYSDQPFVSTDYGRELSDARVQAVEVERVSDDPPERIQGWMSTISTAAMQQLDRTLLLDLLMLETDPVAWAVMADVAANEIERLTGGGDVAGGLRLLEALVREAADGGRSSHRSAASRVLEQLATGSLIRHAVLHLRSVADDRVEQFARLCQMLGPGVIRPLAEALAAEQDQRALRHLRELLLGFGAAGRHSVEQLKLSPNPAVRRTAIELLRVFGGDEALPELTSMLDDADPQVQREAIHAIVLIGSVEAYAVLERALVGADTKARDTILQQLLALRDPKAAPLLCYVLTHTTPRGRLAHVHMAVIDTLGALGHHGDSAPTLKQVLHRGAWWAPLRTARLREAAAVALRRIGSPEALAVLRDAASRGTRGVRSAARTQVALVRPASQERAR